MGDNDSLLDAGEALSDHDSGISSLAGDEQEEAEVGTVGTPMNTTATDSQQQQRT